MKGVEDPSTSFSAETKKPSEDDVRRQVKAILDEVCEQAAKEPRRGGLRLPPEAGCFHDWQKTNFALGWLTNWGFERGPKVELCSKCGVLRIDTESVKRYSA